jgi:hypothetical protein
MVVRTGFSLLQKRIEEETSNVFQPKSVNASGKNIQELWQPGRILMKCEAKQEAFCFTQTAIGSFRGRLILDC